MIPFSRPGGHFQWEAGVTFVREEGGHFPSEFPLITYDAETKEWKQISLLPIMPSISYRVEF